MKLGGVVSLLSAFGLGLFAVGCGDDASGMGSGSLSVLLEAEDVIVEGLEPGTSGESIQEVSCEGQVSRGEESSRIEELQASFYAQIMMM